MENFSESDKEFLDMTQGERKNFELKDGLEDPCMSELNGVRLDFPKDEKPIFKEKDLFPMDREKLLVLLSISLNINFNPTTKEALSTVYNNLFHDGYLAKSSVSGVWHLSLKGENYLGELVSNQNLFESKLSNDGNGIKTYPVPQKPDLYELAYESYHMLLELTEKKAESENYFSLYGSNVKRKVDDSIKSLQEKTELENRETKQCEFDMGYAGRCKGDSSPYSKYCKTHKDMKCVSCGEQATHQCSETFQFVCGSPLCDNCSHSPVNYGPNHVPIKK